MAWATADSQSAAVLTATAGPNSSSWANAEDGSTSATTVGATMLPSTLSAREHAGPAFGGRCDRLPDAFRFAGADQRPHLGRRGQGSPTRMASTFGTSASRNRRSLQGAR